MNISAITFTGRPSGMKPTTNKTIQKMREMGLPTNRYKTPRTQKSLAKEIETYREFLKEEPDNQLFRQLLENAMSEIKGLKNI